MTNDSPYLSAFHAYHRHGEPCVSWTEALDFHLQFGMVISHPRLFLMVRRVVWDAPDIHHLSFDSKPPETGNDWHVWVAAGTLPEALKVARQWGARRISFQRRNHRLHRWECFKERRRPAYFKALEK